MRQNKNINERSNGFKKIDDSNSDNSNNTYFCANCLKELDSKDRDIVKDVDNNIFCDRECRSYFRKENYELIEEVIGGF